MRFPVQVRNACGVVEYVLIHGRSRARSCCCLQEVKAEFVRDANDALKAFVSVLAYNVEGWKAFSFGELYAFPAGPLSAHVDEGSGVAGLG